VMMIMVLFYSLSGFMVQQVPAILQLSALKQQTLCTGGVEFCNVLIYSY